MSSFDWLRDELILALDAYLKLRPKAPGPHMPEARDLSDTLRTAFLHPRQGRPANFRSPASVVMKLMNFRALDPEYGGKGLSAGGRGDRAVWDDFCEEPARLAATASAIRSVLKAGVQSMEANPTDAEAIEGSLLTRLHCIHPVRTAG
jgi:5-methylcytosine-specific restriction enzyme A